MAFIQLSRYEAEEGDLPDACMCCGAPATERKRRRFISHPFWVYVLLPFGYIPYVIVAAVLTEEVRCYTLFCPRHKNHWRKRTLIIWGAFAAMLALIAGGLAIVGSMTGHISKSVQDSLFGMICVASPLLVVCWLSSIPIMQVTAIHPADVRERGLILKRISPAFADAVREHRANNRNAERPEEAYIRDNRVRRSPPRYGDLE